MKKVLLLLGRICLSLIFAASAVGKVFDWDETVHYLRGALYQWMHGVVVPDMFHQLFSFLSSYAVPILIIATLIEGVGGLFVLLGFKPRLGAVLLIFFLIPVTLIMHPFWRLSDQDKILQMTFFMKNLSILGGLIILATNGGDPKSSS